MFRMVVDIPSLNTDETKRSEMQKKLISLLSSPNSLDQIRFLCANYLLSEKLNVNASFVSSHLEECRIRQARDGLTKAIWLALAGHQKQADDILRLTANTFPEAMDLGFKFAEAICRKRPQHYWRWIRFDRKSNRLSGQGHIRYGCWLHAKGKRNIAYRILNAFASFNTSEMNLWTKIGWAECMCGNPRLMPVFMRKDARLQKLSPEQANYFVLFLVGQGFTNTAQRVWKNIPRVNHGSVTEGGTMDSELLHRFVSAVMMKNDESRSRSDKGCQIGDGLCGNRENPVMTALGPYYAYLNLFMEKMPLTKGLVRIVRELATFFEAEMSIRGVTMKTLLAMVKCCVAGGWAEKAFRVLMDSKSSPQNEGYVYAVSAQLYWIYDDLQNARNILRLVTDKERLTSDTLFRGAVSHALVGQYLEAQRMIWKLHEACPDYFVRHSNEYRLLACLTKSMGHKEMANTIWQKALAQDKTAHLRQFLFDRIVPPSHPIAIPSFICIDD